MASSDKRMAGGNRYRNARLQFNPQTFPPTASAALIPTLPNVNGTIIAIEIVTTDTEDGITYTVAITNANGATLFSEASLADDSTHRRLARSNKATQDADFNEQPVADETLVCTITPSAAPDAGDVGAKTATVTVDLIVE